MFLVTPAPLIFTDDLLQSQNLHTFDVERLIKINNAADKIGATWILAGSVQLAVAEDVSNCRKAAIR